MAFVNKEIVFFWQVKTIAFPIKRFGSPYLGRKVLGVLVLNYSPDISWYPQLLANLALNYYLYFFSMFKFIAGKRDLPNSTFNAL
jgi:hypothetical protein